MGDSITGLLPIRLDAGYRLSPNLYAGAFFQDSIAFINNAETGCSSDSAPCAARELVFGGDLDYHLSPGRTFDSWGGIGVGYEIVSFAYTAPEGRATVSTTVRGPQFLNFQIGVDYKATPGLGVAPFAMLSVGEFSNCSYSVTGGSGPFNCSIPHLALHEWFTIGMRGTYDFGW
ncbi:MAG: hypothetical protein ACLP1X_10895 [Polyangiaceae bacterium]